MDWPKIHDRYMAMVEHCASREDMAFVMGERISELTVGNACVKSAGDTEKKPSSSTRASGGDAFPNYFRGAGLGKLIGMRTWGGLVGIWGNPALMVDGGDPQLDAAIGEVLTECDQHPFQRPKRPAYPDKSGMGIVETDK